MYAINNTRYSQSVAVTPNSLLHAVSPITDIHTGVYNFYTFVLLDYFKYFEWGFNPPNDESQTELR